MTFPILGGNSAVTGAFSIDNSLRFNDDDSSTLSRTPSSAGNRQTWTFSAWFKRCKDNTRGFVFAGGEGNQYGNDFGIEWGNDGNLWAYNYATTVIRTTAVFRDPSAWYHLVFAVDTTQATASNRIKVYINGEQISSFITTNYPSQNDNTGINTTHIHTVGSTRGFLHYDGYMADVHLIDGSQKAPTDFGEFDSDSGIWKPIRYSGSYGTNGFKFDFSDSGSLGADSSGNGNNFTPTNLASTDQMLDTPTNNFATLNGSRGAIGNYDNGTLAEGNLKFITPNQSIFSQQEGTIFPTSGKWYWEVFFVSSGNDAGALGIQRSGLDIGAYPGKTANGYGYDSYGSGLKIHNNSSSSYGSSYGVNDIIGVALDLDNGTLTFYKNNSSQGQAFSGIDSSLGWSFSYGTGYTNTFVVNFGQDSSFAGNKTAQGNADGNGYGDFYYAPPSGYLALCTQNLATALSPTIDDGSAYFHTQLYTGNGTSQTITNDAYAGDFQPDFLWIKNRQQTDWHNLINSTVGATKRIASNNNLAENTNANNVSAFASDGFSVGSDHNTNANGENYVAWQWKANGGTTSSNTDGSITSTVQVNTTAGFSILTYTGTGSNATIGHGLSKAPEIIIVKNRDYSPSDWQTGSDYLTSWAYRLKLNGTNAEASVTSSFNSTAPTSTVINIGNNDDVNRSGDSHLIYAFHSVEGYSKIGSYTGNGSSDGPFVYTGFRPAWVMVKAIDHTIETSWNILDSKRDIFNPENKYLNANESNAEASFVIFDFLSNGFKCKNIGNTFNVSSKNFIYIAFAEHPFVDSNGVPVTAR